MSQKSPTDARYKQAIKRLIIDSRSLCNMTITLSDESRKLTPLIDKVLKFKQRYDINHTELDVFDDVQEINKRYTRIRDMTENMRDAINKL